MVRSLLIVDDEKLVRWTIQQSMGQENYRVVSASNGEEALAKLSNEHFDVIITDLVMPGINGIAVTQKAKEFNPSTQVIMMTAYGSSLDQEEARKAGVAYFINKPFQISEVKTLVSELMPKE